MYNANCRYPLPSLTLIQSAASPYAEISLICILLMLIISIKSCKIFLDPLLLSACFIFVAVVNTLFLNAKEGSSNI